jgi:hypothetical protein
MLCVAFDGLSPNGFLFLFLYWPKLQALPLNPNSPPLSTTRAIVPRSRG